MPDIDLFSFRIIGATAPAFLDSGSGRIYLQLQLSFPVAWHRSFSFRITGATRLLSWIPDPAGFTFSCS
ncbi:hypothetical protein [Bacillus sp. LJBS17]|uniref:hypothetical protein n=1 Tax=Bacillus sp. LJBS17 TaxID=2859227 RepID=UPI001C56790D|nr:hypothetical protein [Bacillus sp. LJBS17]QXW84052.1 hypothetical protein KXZ66_22125 [Bacillus sp. LJBS17]